MNVPDRTGENGAIAEQPQGKTQPLCDTQQVYPCTDCGGAHPKFEKCDADLRDADARLYDLQRQLEEAKMAWEIADKAADVLAKRAAKAEAELSQVRQRVEELEQCERIAAYHNVRAAKAALAKSDKVRRKVKDHDL